MKQEIKIGIADHTALVFIPDPASTDGSGKTGLTAASLTVSYTRVETDNDVTVADATGSLNDLAALTTAHTDWGVLEVSSTLAPGLYRLDIADAVFASGAWAAVVYVMITTSAAGASPIEYILRAQIIEDVPTSAAISSIDGKIDTVDTVVDAIKVKTDSLTFTVANQVDANVESINATTVLGNGTAGNLWRG